MLEILKPLGQSGRSPVVRSLFTPVCRINIIISFYMSWYRKRLGGALQENFDSWGNPAKELRLSLWNLCTKIWKKYKVSKTYFVYHPSYFNIDEKEKPKRCIKSTKLVILRTMK